MWSCVCRIVEGAMDLFLKMRHKGETTEIEHLLCVYLKLLFSEVFSHKPKLKKRRFPLGGVHKLRSQDLAIFDHLPPSVDTFYT